MTKYDCIDDRCVPHEKGAFSDPSCNNECNTKYDRPMLIATLSISGVILILIIITLFLVFQKN